MMHYLPKLESDDCIVVDNLNSGYIRVYDRVPTANSTVSYIDYFIDNDYIERHGSQTFSNYNYSINCQSHSNYTTGYFYRLDFPSILLMFFIILFIFYFILKKIIRVFFHGFRWC